MLDPRSVQIALQAKGLYRGKLDGILGPQSEAGVSTAVVQELGDKAKPWSKARKLLAFEQIVMRDAGLNPGSIDGLIGPQTLYALEAWQNLQRDTDPPAPTIAHQPTVFPRQKDVPTFYGKVGQNQTMLDLPFKMRLAWDTAKVINRFSIHAKAHDSAAEAFKLILAHYGEAKIKELGLDLFGGCLNVRTMRGGSNPSMHSWGIAIDFDPARNRLRWGSNRAQMAKPEYSAFLDIWESVGWISLGRERNFDWMHVQAARL
jgi:D-alanyl-D-alanine carboxypeptidase